MTVAVLMSLRRLEKYLEKEASSAKQLIMVMSVLHRSRTPTLLFDPPNDLGFDVSFVAQSGQLVRRCFRCALWKFFMTACCLCAA